MNILIELFYLAILSFPLIWEITDDRLGDTPKNKKQDVVWRTLFCILVGITVGGIGCQNPSFPQHRIVTSFLFSGAIHFLFFDYIINYVLIKNKIIKAAESEWFTYMGKTAELDRSTWWINIGPYNRLYIKLGIFVVTGVLYHLI